MKKLLLLSSVAMIAIAAPSISNATDYNWEQNSYTTVQGDSEEAQNNQQYGYTVDVDADLDADAEREGEASVEGEESENSVARVDVDADLDVDADVNRTRATMENQQEAKLAIKEKAY